MAFITDLAAACKTKPEDRGDDGFGRRPAGGGPVLVRRSAAADRRQSDFDLKPAMGYKKQPFYTV